MKSFRQLIENLNSFVSPKELVKLNMLAMDKRSNAYGVDTNSANQMKQLTSTKKYNKGKLSNKERMSVIKNWDSIRVKSK